MIKKQILSLKINRFFKENNIILLYQYNNIYTEKWNDLKNILSQIQPLLHKQTDNGFSLQKKNQSRNCLIIKNTIANLIIKNMETTKDSCNQFSLNFSNLLQGPCFLIATDSIKNISLIKKALNNNQHVIFLGGIIGNQIYTHLDINALCELDDSVYPEFIQQLNNQIQFQFFLYNSIQQQCIENMNKCQNILLSLLQHLSPSHTKCD